MRTIGVLGGMGPQATMDFEARLHRASQRLIPQRGGTGYPPTVVYYCRHAPVRLADDGTPRFPIEPDPRLLDAAARLGAWADFLVVPCNGAHLVLPEIERAAGRPVLSLIAVTLEEVARRGWRTVGVLGMGDPVVYTRPLAERGLATRTIDGGLRDRLNAAVLEVMEGRDHAGPAAAAQAAVDALRGQGVDGVILGCTEIPLMLGEPATADPFLINPAPLLADAAVRAAIA